MSDNNASESKPKPMGLSLWIGGTEVPLYYDETYFATSIHGPDAKSSGSFTIHFPSPQRKRKIKLECIHHVPLSKPCVECEALP